MSSRRDEAFGGWWWLPICCPIRDTSKGKSKKAKVKSEDKEEYVVPSGQRMMRLMRRLPIYCPVGTKDGVDAEVTDMLCRCGT